MFIGEAPGRFGADRTLRPFSGDASGDNFESFLAGAQLSREDCFITNAVLCNPRNEQGNNSPPSRKELEQCSAWLQQQIELIDPLLVVTLGVKALASLDLIETHALRLRDHVAKTNSWFGRCLMPLYHPGARALIHRKRSDQQRDYRRVAQRFRALVSAQSK